MIYCAQRCAQKFCFIPAEKKNLSGLVQGNSNLNWKASQSSGDKPVGNTPLQEHPGIICDGCEGKVIRRRYKCTECPDYDLCQSCESKGIHSEHNFMMYDTPVHPGYGFPFSWPPRLLCTSGPVNHVAKDNPQLLLPSFFV